jgi:acyl-coenzyme A thioesterase PaaI-like protein
MAEKTLTATLPQQEENPLGIVNEMLNERFGEDDIVDEEKLAQSTTKKKSHLKTYELIKNSLSGYLMKLEDDYAKVSLKCISDMSVDNKGLIHSGFMFNAANFAAIAAINEPNSILVGSKTKFLAPVKIDDVVIFEADSRFSDSRKRDIDVIGKVDGVKVFEGEFYCVVMNEHILDKVRIAPETPTEE